MDRRQVVEVNSWSHEESLPSIRECLKWFIKFILQFKLKACHACEKCSLFVVLEIPSILTFSVLTAVNNYLQKENKFFA